MSDGSSNPIITVDGLWKVFGGTARAASSNPSSLTAEGVVAAGGIPAICDAEFEVRRGEIFVIMGLSGSGKSTLLRCLTGLFDTTAGQIRIDGTDLTAIGAKALTEFRRKKISMVFQNFALLPHLNVLDNVAFPLRVQGVDTETRHKKAEDTIGLVGLEGKENFFPAELSGGQQQRVGIARSLVTDPDVWFLDEPFSALDPLIRRDMQKEFQRLQAKLHKTIVFVTHDLEEAVRLGDRILLMEKGHIVQIGTPEDLVLRPTNDYVRAFTESLPKTSVVKVHSVVEPLTQDTLDGPTISADATLGEVATQVVSSDQPIGVVDEDGKIVGQVSRKAVAAWLT